MTPDAATCDPVDHRRALGRTLRLVEARAGAPQRAELEAFVARAFERRHDARVQSFMPTLLSFRDASGALRGVIGLRTGRPVDRRQVVEVGNLAGANCRTAMRMVAALPAYLLAQEYEWIVFTATNAVRGILQGFRAPLAELARADASRVASAPDHWGRYYDTDPRVLAGYLPASRRIPGFSTTA